MNDMDGKNIQRGRKNNHEYDDEKKAKIEKTNREVFGVKHYLWHFNAHAFLHYLFFNFIFLSYSSHHFHHFEIYYSVINRKY